MPIKNLTDRETIKPRLPRIGKLKKGGEKTGNKPGKDLSYFRFVSDNPDVEEAFFNAYGKQPSLINALIFQETTEEAFPSWIECWDASGLVFRSDGENWILWRDGSKYVRESIPHCDQDGQFEVGRLEIIIPELLQQGFVGTVTLETHSNHDLRHITSILMSAEQERKSLRGTQFVLRRVEEEISVPGWGDREGKRSKANKWLVKLELPRRLFDNLLESRSESIDIPMIESGEIVAEDTPQKHAIPTDKDGFFHYINQRVEVPYENPFHLENAIKKELPKFEWKLLPKGPQKAATAAIDHAQQKTQSATQESMLPDETRTGYEEK